MKNKKVAIVDPLGGHGSSHHYYLFGQALGLKNSGVQVYIYTCDETSLDFQQGLVKLYYRNIYSSAPKWLLGIRYLRGTFLSLFHILKNQIPSAHFHLFQVGILEFFNIFLFKMTGRKVIVTIHDVEAFAKERSSIRKYLYALVDEIIVHNEYSKQELLSKNFSLARKMKVISHGNYLPFLNKTITIQEAREKIGISLDKKVILFFGMIKEVKGLEVLLKALPKMIAEDASIRLLIAGKVWKTDFSRYQKLIDEANMQKYCIVHQHFIPDEEVEMYYMASDLVALPYKKIYQSGVLLMSMSYETPVLVSDLPPMKEVVEDMETGFIFESENANDLAEKSLLALSSETKLEEVKNAALEKLKRVYDWQTIGKQLEKVYR
jgi:D-inositol-3-phosphate glycosyltransferase